MPSRSLLHRTKYEKFKTWLESQEGIKFLPANGTWELLKWDSGDKLRPAIVFDNTNPEHLSLNDKATPYYFKWKNRNKTEK